MVVDRVVRQWPRILEVGNFPAEEAGAWVDGDNRGLIRHVEVPIVRIVNNMIRAVAAGMKPRDRPDNLPGPRIHDRNTRRADLPHRSAFVYVAPVAARHVEIPVVRVERDLVGTVEA